MSAAFTHSVYHFIVSKHSAQGRTPVYHRFAEVGNAVVHQHFLLLYAAHRLPFVGSELKFFRTCYIKTVRRTLFFEEGNEFFDRLCLLARVAIEGVVHLLERPLCPMVVTGFASAHFTTPVKAETNLVQLLAVAIDVVRSGNCGMLARLNSILFGGKTIGIVTHGVQHVEAVQALVACVDVRGDVAEGVSHVKTRTRGVGEHIQYVVLGA